jgi:uncharacterized coiled-coil protein SlyX
MADIVMKEIETNVAAWNIDISGGENNVTEGLNGVGCVQKRSFLELKNLHASYNSKYSIAINQARAVIAKKEATSAYQDAIRAFLKEHVTYNSAITDEVRRNMRLLVHKSVHTSAPQEITHPERMYLRPNQLQ